MDNPTPPLAAETDALRETYAALNRNDIEGIVKIFDAQIVCIEPAEFPGGGTYRGLAAVKAHFPGRAALGLKEVASRNASLSPATRSSCASMCA